FFDFIKAGNQFAIFFSVAIKYGPSFKQHFTQAPTEEARILKALSARIPPGVTREISIQPYNEEPAVKQPD
ncbi:MAG: hypothetical protein ABI557_20010, partial [Aureliella sp.]